MSSSRDEARSLTRGAFVLLALSVLRYGGDAVNRVSTEAFHGSNSDAETVLDTLGERTRAAVEDDERRRRPMGPSETLDPNRVDVLELDRLPGVGPSTAAAIVAARDAGMVFRRATDLLDVRGIGPSTLERMAPHLDFASAPRTRSGRTTPKAPSVLRGPVLEGAMPVDVNSADVERLESLPGIGPALASRIVAERQRGAFATLDDLTRVRGIGAATVSRLQGLAVAHRTR